MTNNKPEFKTAKENYEEALAEARKLTARDIKIALNQRAALHKWAVDAYETALAEKKNFNSHKSPGVRGI